MSTTKDTNKWSIEIKRITKKIKLNPSDDFDTEYVDIDQLLHLYVENFRNYKYDTQRTLLKKFGRKIQD